MKSQPHRETHRIFDNAAAFLGGEFFYRLVNFFSCILIARSLGESGYGQFSFIYVYLSFFESFIEFGLNPILTRELSQKPEKAPQIIGNALLFRTGLILCILPFAMWLIRQLGYPLTVQKGVFLASFQLFLTLRPLFEVIFRVRLLMIYPALWNAARAFINLALVGLVTFLHPSMPWFILTYFVSGLIALAGLAFSSRRQIPIDFRPNRPLLFHLIRQALPLVMSGYLSLIYYRVDVLMLSMMKTFKDVGYYSVATRLTESLHMISMSLLVSFFPLFSHAFKADRGEFDLLTRKAFRYILLLGFPITLGGTLVARDLIQLFFGSSYLPSAVTLTILLWYTFFSFIGNVLASVGIASGKQMADMWISAAMALFNIGMNALLIPKYSYNGAALATVMTEIVGISTYSIYLMTNADVRLRFPGREFMTALKVNLLFAGLLFLIQHTASVPVIPFVIGGILGYAGLLLLFRIVSWEEIQTYLFQRSRMKVSLDGQ